MQTPPRKKVQGAERDNNEHNYSQLLFALLTTLLYNAPASRAALWDVFFMQLPFHKSKPQSDTRQFLLQPV